MAPASADRNLLFGILALQLDFISRDQLVAAMQAWVLEKTTSLGELLLRQGALGTDRLALLDALVKSHLALHGNDPHQSLAALNSMSAIKDALAPIADTDLHQTLAGLPALQPAGSQAPGQSKGEGEADDPNVTVAPESMGQSSASAIRFRILRPHRQGGLGEVVVAFDGELHREVALKKIKERHADDPDARARFRREGEITGRLEHPGIVPIYSLGHYGSGRPFYAMRFVKGDSLEDAISHFHKADAEPRSESERTLELRKLLGRFVDVCEAISYAHSRGVLHRDLKPGNIMLGRYGETLVVDWGLAKAQGEAEGGGKAEAPALTSLAPVKVVSGGGSTATEMGAVLGTPAYMSPEQAEGRLGELGPASDVYSLGATLYALLTGHASIEGERDVGRILHRVCTGDIPLPRQVNAKVPVALEAVCCKAMALKPKDRYATAQELADEVERWLADEPVRAWPEPSAVRARRWVGRHRTLVTSAAAVLLVGLVGLAAGLVGVGGLNRELTALADSETKAREDAEKLATANKLLAQDADARRRQAEKMSIQARFDYFYSRSREEPATAMLGYAQLLPAAVALGDRDLEQSIRLHLDGWGRELPVVREVLNHKGGVVAVAFSPDGKTVLTGSRDGTARLWEAATGKPIGEPLKHQKVVFAVAFSPDGKTVLTGGYDKTARLWDAATGLPIGEPLRHQDQVTFVAFSPNSNTVVTASYGGPAQLWESATGTPIGVPLQDSFTGSDGHAVAFSPDGKTVLTGSLSKTARLWESATGKLMGEPFQHQNQDSVRAVAFSPDGKTVLTGSYDGTARLWDAATGKQIGEPLRHRDSVELVTFSPDGKTVLTVCRSDTAQLWETATGKPIGKPLEHQNYIRTVAFSPDGKTLVTGSQDKSVRLRETATGRAIGRLQHQDHAWAVAFSPDGKTILTGSHDKAARLWEAATGNFIGEPLKPALSTLTHFPYLSAR